MLRLEILALSIIAQCSMTRPNAASRTRKMERITSVGAWILTPRKTSFAFVLAFCSFQLSYEPASGRHATAGDMIAMVFRFSLKIDDVDDIHFDSTPSIQTVAEKPLLGGCCKKCIPVPFLNRQHPTTYLCCDKHPKLYFTLVHRNTSPCILFCFCLFLRGSSTC